MLIDDDGIELLDQEECRSLLGTEHFGRVGVTVGALPVILPVNYTTLDGDVVFATGSGTKLRAACRNAVIAFEVDHMDPATRSGWSVLVVGPSREITDPAEIELLRADGLQPFATGRDHVVRMSSEFVSGRRIHHDQ